MVRFFELRP
jgi:serine/threonine protein phosphatase PrpC